MIRTFFEDRIGIALWISFCGFLAPTVAQSFPEYAVRDYASCGSCHVSPTGGGVLTSFGRAQSEQISSWSRAGEGERLSGQLLLPSWAILGGDFRTLSLAKDNGVYKDNRTFPMQADLEFGVSLFDSVIGVMSLGAYDGGSGSQRHYLMYAPDERFYARFGQFMPAFGIYSADHALKTRQALGFDQGRETLNVEVGYLGDFGEVVIDSIMGSSQRGYADNEKGASARTAWYAGDGLQVGLSLFKGDGTIWKRTIYGIFGMLRLSENIFALSEFDLESQKPTDSTDTSVEANTREVTSTKIGWEMTRGLILLATMDSAHNVKGGFDPNEWSAGPGIQWLPRPHLEFLGQAQAAYNDRWSHHQGYLVTLMGHYYL